MECRRIVVRQTYYIYKWRIVILIALQNDIRTRVKQKKFYNRDHELECDWSCPVHTTNIACQWTNWIDRNGDLVHHSYILPNLVLRIIHVDILWLISWLLRYYLHKYWLLGILPPIFITCNTPQLVGDIDITMQAIKLRRHLLIA